ncbi:MAG: hypothetical protein EP332_04215 [Bacteroidetes bacterium]|nr:MAG: hypothetical protein EP332_04215 [Bacteroidota bacterium]
MISALRLKPICLTKRILFSFILLFFSIASQADQALLVRNDSLKKAFYLLPGLDVAFRYSGYQGQEEEVRGIILSISDSAIQVKRTRFYKKDTFTIQISDLLGFRYFTTARHLGALAYDVGTLGGNILLYTYVLSPAPIPPLARLGISFGVGLGTYGIRRLLFPEKIKNTTANGWVFKVVNR